MCFELPFLLQSYESKGTFFAHYENENKMKRPLFSYCCVNNRGKSLCWSRVALAKTNIGHYVTHKFKKKVIQIFVFIYMFLLCKFAFNISNNNGGVPSYFSCYRATSERVRFLLFRK